MDRLALGVSYSFIRSKRAQSVWETFWTPRDPVNIWKDHNNSYQVTQTGGLSGSWMKWSQLNVQLNLAVLNLAGKPSAWWANARKSRTSSSAMGIWPNVTWSGSCVWFQMTDLMPTLALWHKSAWLPVDIFWRIGLLWLLLVGLPQPWGSGRARFEQLNHQRLDFPRRSTPPLGWKWIGPGVNPPCER